MTGFFIVLPSIIVGFLLGRWWERIVIKSKKIFGIKEDER